MDRSGDIQFFSFQSVCLSVCVTAISFNICHKFRIVSDKSFHISYVYSLWKDLFATRDKVICQDQGQISRSYLSKTRQYWNICISQTPTFYLPIVYQNSNVPVLQGRGVKIQNS